jgi:signal transduction histidine kinase
MRTSIGSGADTVRGDRDRLEQALQNLAANAVRYAPPGSAVRLTSRVDGSPVAGVALSIEDEGPAGIAPDHLPHIFDRFYKADASRPFGRAQGGPNEVQGDYGTSVSGGSGLGLSIVKAIVERHGGRISAVSCPGRTVFEIVLPAGPAA